MKNKLPSILIILSILILTACAPKAPVFDATKFGTAEKDVTYCIMNELPQTMDVYYPSSGGPWPAVLYVHGGSWYQGDKAEGEGWRSLNDNGFLVVSVNYRLGDYQTKFPAMVEDVKCAVRHLKSHSAEYNLDPDRIGAIGASAGGHLAALLGTADESAGWDVGEYLGQSSLIQAVVVISGISDFTDHIPNGLNTSIFYAFGRLAGRNAPENLAVSPIFYVTPDDPSFLVIHGDRDGVVPVEQARILQDKLAEAGVPSRLIIVEGGDHSLQSPTGGNVDPSATQINQMILEFLEGELK